MTESWRQATLTAPHYLPELDLIALAPDGTGTGFCICWLATAIDGQCVAQIEPLGVVPAYQRLGLGRALLLTAMKQASERGAEAIRVYAESYNEASQGVYATASFRETHRLGFFLRVFDGSGDQLIG